MKNTPEQLADLINERISEDGWFITPVASDSKAEVGFMLRPPRNSGLLQKATRWRTVHLTYPEYIETETPLPCKAIVEGRPVTLLAFVEHPEFPHGVGVVWEKWDNPPAFCENLPFCVDAREVGIVHE